LRPLADDSRAAARLLAAHVEPTRLAPAASLSGGGRDVFLKLEIELPTGSFKVRGAVYSLTKRLARRPIDEVVAASTGNHGAAVAYAARLLGVRARIFVPLQPNPVKAARIRELGAVLVETGRDLTEAIDAAAQHTDATGAFFLHDASDPDVPIGAGTIACEILDQLPAVDAIYVPMGDTALIRGIATAAKAEKPSISIVGVVAEQAPAYYLSWLQRTAVETASADTIADGLAVTRPLAPNVEAICHLVDEVVTVGEEEMIAGIVHLMTHERITAEPAGAAATAALIKRKGPGTHVVALVTGANIAPDVLARVEQLRLCPPC
jgi:threonine dehydratase